MSSICRHAVRLCIPCLSAALLLLPGGCATQTRTTPDAPPGQLAVRAIDNVQWSPLNPARGNAGPQAADLWGDRTSEGPTGFLVRFAEGFSSPPHIHNTSYRGIVIDGLIHNDDPEAAEMWMPTGSYWTQPAGEVHITSAQGAGRMAYIEIPYGPYLVRPVEQAHDNGERAINVHADNLVWLDASTTRQISLPPNGTASDGPRMAYLWGDPQDAGVSGVLIALPASGRYRLTGNDPDLRAVVIQGSLLEPDSGEPLAPGSLIAGTRMQLSSSTGCWLYVRCAGTFQLQAD